MHPTIIHRCIKVRIPTIPWSNRSTRWSIITLTRLLLMSWRWSRILDFAWWPLLSLSTPFLLIFGQEFFKTRPCLNFGGVPRFTGRTGQTGPMTGQTGRTGQTAAVAGQTGRLVVGLLLVLPPSVFAPWGISCVSFFSGLSSPITTFFPLVDSAWLGRTSTLGLFNSNIWTGKGVWSICILERTNRPSLMADWICLRNTMQSLVAYEKVLWN